MRKLILLALVLCFACAANAQIGNLIKNKINQKVEEGVNNAVDKAVDNAIDKTFDNTKKAIDKEKNDNSKTISDDPHDNGGWTCPACGATGNHGNFCKECAAKKPGASSATETNTASESGWTCPACGHKGNTGKFCNECGAKKPEESTASATWKCEKCGHEGNTGKFCDECGAPKGAQKINQNDMAWNNYDFVAGDEIIFEDNNANEPLGEFPQMWDAFHGAAEIVQINGVKCINMQNAEITPLYQSNKTYLTDVVTIEFDIYYRHEKVWEQEMGEDLHGWGDYNIYLYTSDKISKDDRGEASLHIGLPMQMDEDLNTKTQDQHFYYDWRTNDETRSGEYQLRSVEHEAWHHIAISFNKRAYKVYFDNQRVANIPNAIAPKWLVISGNNANQRLFFVKNVRIAKGAVPLYDRMASDGKIITYGITFDVGKSVIKPESMGEINRIVKLMQDNPELKFEVQGHTDNTGNAASNQTLSEARAKAIVDKLVEMGISASRLTSVGKGQSSPIADNSTDEGRAKNRRVEFVKK